MTFGIKWVNFDPIPQDSNYFSLCIGKAGLKVGERISHTQADTRDETSLSRAFYLAKQPQRRQLIFLTPVWQYRMKRTSMLTQLMLLQSSLDEELAIYLLAMDAQSNTADRIVATSKPINEAINSLIYSTDSLQRSEIIDVISPASAKIDSHIHTKCQVEIVAFSSDNVAQFVQDKLGLGDNDASGGDIRAEPRGTIDFHNERDRWQILSRELQ